MKDADLTDPEEGFVGMLTQSEYDRFSRAIDTARTHLSWWRIAGHLKTGDTDELHIRSSDPAIPLPATWLAAEEITNLLHEINQWATLTDVATHGYEFALLITREVETAAHKWPMSDRPHKVRFLRCRACQQVTLKYYPPRLASKSHSQSTPVPVYDPQTPAGMVALTDMIDVMVKCTNPDCRAVEDPKNFAHDAALIMEENEIAKRRLGDRRRRTGQGEQVEGDDLPVGESPVGSDEKARSHVVAVPA